MKKTLALLLLTALLTAPLVGCGTADHGDEPTKTTTKSGEKENALDNLPPYDASDANPISDFQYQVGEDGGITLTKYIGEDKTVVIPPTIEDKAVTVIEERSFAGASIESLAMPHTVIYINAHAFIGCEQLTNIQMSASLITIAWGAFMNCNSLTNIDLSMNSLKYLDNETFMGCKNLKTVKFGDNIQLIRDKAFYDCESLEEAILPKNLKEIGQYAFGNCLGLRTIWIPKTVEKWGWSPFIGNISVTEIVFEDELKRIGSYGAFAGCQVEILRIPASVEYITDIAFTAFPKLKEVYFDGAAPEVGGDIFATPEQGVKIYYNPSMSGWDTTPLRQVYTLIPLS